MHINKAFLKYVIKRYLISKYELCNNFLFLQKIFNIFLRMFSEFQFSKSHDKKLFLRSFVKTYFCTIGFFCEYRDWQKVQFNHDLLKQRHEYLCRKMVAGLKLNEIRSIIKLGNLMKRDWLKVWGNVLERWPRKFLQWNVFTTVMKI